MKLILEKKAKNKKLKNSQKGFHPSTVVPLIWFGNDEKEEIYPLFKGYLNYQKINIEKLTEGPVAILGYFMGTGRFDPGLIDFITKDMLPKVKKVVLMRVHPCQTNPNRDLQKPNICDCVDVFYDKYKKAPLKEAGTDHPYNIEARDAILSIVYKSK